MRIELEQPDKKKPSSSDSFIPPKDEKRTFKSEIKKMREMGWKGGWHYFLDYYRNATLVIILLLICAISLITSVLKNRRPYVIEVNLFNNYVEDTDKMDEFSEAFAAHMGKNLKDYQMLFSATDYFNPQEATEATQAIIYRMAAMIAAGELDIIGGDRTYMDYYSSGEPDSVYFLDLEEVLPKDLFTRLETAGRLYRSKYCDEDGNVIGEYVSGIEISHSRLTDEAGLAITPSYLGIVVNTSRLDTAIEFIRWVFYMDEESPESESTISESAESESAG